VINDRKILLARVLFAIALLLAVISTFQNWEIVGNFSFSGDPITQNFRMTGLTTAIGFLQEFDTFFHPTTIPIEPKTCHLVHDAINLSLFLAFLLPIALARIVSYSRMIIWLWVFTAASYLAALIYLHHKYAPSVFLQAAGAGYSGSQLHLSWLSGFYFGCSAVAMHLLGMIVIYFSFDRKVGEASRLPS
jgi:hypothetical protein